MRPIALRRRVSELQLQWSFFFVLAVGLVAVPLYLELGRVRVEEQVALAQMSARNLDTALAAHFQILQRVTQGSAIDDRLLARLRAARLQGLFRRDIYVVDEAGGVLLADPPGSKPVPFDLVGRRETVTQLIGTEEEGDLRVAMVQPFHVDGDDFFVVSEMDPGSSAMNSLLGSLFPGGEVHAFVVDQGGFVIGCSEGHEQLSSHSVGRGTWSGLRSTESIVLEDVPCSVCSDETSDGFVIAVAPLRIAPWGIAIEREKRALLDLAAPWYLLIGSVALLVAMGLVLSRALSRSVVVPLKELSVQAERMKRGDLSSEIAVEGDLEIQVLASALDEARERLSTTLGELEALNEELEEKVHARTLESRKLVWRLLDAGEEERRRIARELHDEISQLLTVVQISIEGLDAECPGLDKARSVLTKAQKEIHRIIFDLRPSLLDDLGLAAAIRWYAENYLAPKGVEVSLQIQEGLRLAPEVEITVFRIYQEVITNILRHSRADHASIELYATDDKLVLMVEDNGRGFDPETGTGGAGIVGMRERADLVGARLRVESEPEAGASVVLEVPLET
jgi:signal transduction histidine kinase